MAGLDPVSTPFFRFQKQDVDGRVKSGHDEAKSSKFPIEGFPSRFV
jgi:hypothetical protein